MQEEPESHNSSRKHPGAGFVCDPCCMRRIRGLGSDRVPGPS